LAWRSKTVVKKRGSKGPLFYLYPSPLKFCFFVIIETGCSSFAQIRCRISVVAGYLPDEAHFMSGAESGNGKILVIEDNRDSRDILSKLLRMSGYEVLSATDGETGYEAAASFHPDLIITDINMPRMDGIEFVKRVRASELLAKTPVLVVTAFGLSAAREAVEAGADAAAEKPFDFDRFLGTVEELISRGPDDGRIG
jgi:CheY-like chemotaxis protein